VRVPAGAQTVSGETSNGLKAKTELTVIAGQRVSTQLVFPGGVEIPFGVKDGILLVDGVPFGVTPIRIDDIAPGKHLFAFRLPGKPDSTAEVVIRAGERTILTLDRFEGLTRALAPTDYTPWAWTAVAIGLVTAGVGGYYLQLGLSEAEALCAGRNCDADGNLRATEAVLLEVAPQREESEFHQGLGWTLFGAGGALVVTGITLFVLDPGVAPASVKSAVRIAPQDDGALVLWGGVF
jgi:hypothetical protein